jgi:hypothetical protein
MCGRERGESGGSVGEKTNKVERAKQGLNVNKNRMRVSLQRKKEREREKEQTHRDQYWSVRLRG